jgi:dihydroneopterin aldolase
MTTFAGKLNKARLSIDFLTRDLIDISSSPEYPTYISDIDSEIEEMFFDLIEELASDL